MPYDGFVYEKLHDKSKDIMEKQDEINNFDFDERMRPVN